MTSVPENKKTLPAEASRGNDNLDKPDIAAAGYNNRTTVHTEGREGEMRVGSIELHERTVTLGGYEYDDGPVHVTVMPRTFRIREYEDSQIQLRMLIAFAVGLVPFFAMTLVIGWSAPDMIAAACK